MVSIENMRNPKTKQLFSDDVRFSNKSKTCSSARTPASTNRSSPGGEGEESPAENSAPCGPVQSENQQEQTLHRLIRKLLSTRYTAKDPKLAVTNFINALERIPDIIAKRQEKNAEMEKNLPVLQGIVSTTWHKEEELKRLNKDILTLNRQIQLTIQPKKQEEDTNNNELVIGSDMVAARHVPSLKVIVPHTGLKKIS